MNEPKKLSETAVRDIVGELETLIEDHVYFDEAERRIAGIGVMLNDFRAYLHDLKFEGLHDKFNRRGRR
jgi:hypothetical protein